MKNDLTLSVVIPTFNEALNLPLIVPQICDIFGQMDIKGEVVVVDDNSPDATAEVAKQLGKIHNVVSYLREGERSLSAAVIDGFRIANGEIVMVMDADMSHPVTAIPEMIKPILAKEVDITVGSRYIKGGGCKDWSAIRQLISRGAGALAKGITPLSDPTSGFMAVRKSSLEGVKLDPIGWKIVLETVTKLGSPVKEIPIVFSDRQHGESKLTASVQLLYLLHLWRLYGFRRPNLMEFVKFCLVGLSGVFVDTISLLLAVESFGLNKVTGSALSFLCAVSWNFFFNRKWTFQDSQSPVTKKLLSFIAVCSIGLAAKVLIVKLLIDYGGFGASLWYLVANLLGIAASTAVNFLGSKYLVFTKNS